MEGKPIEVDQLAAHVAALRDHQDDLENEFSVRPRDRSRALLSSHQSTQCNSVKQWINNDLPAMYSSLYVHNNAFPYTIKIDLA